MYKEFDTMLYEDDLWPTQELKVSTGAHIVTPWEWQLVSAEIFVIFSCLVHSKNILWSMIRQLSWTESAKKGSSDFWAYSKALGLWKGTVYILSLKLLREQEHNENKRNTLVF
jgi:hypothetical protein